LIEFLEFLVQELWPKKHKIGNFTLTLFIKAWVTWMQVESKQQQLGE